MRQGPGLGTTWLALSALALGGQANAAGTAADVCRRGGVEWIVGGREPSRQDCENAPVARTAARVSPPAGTPRWRDSEGASERRRILEDELRHEQAALAVALSQGAAADPAALGRTRANIAALQGELSRLPPAR